jgi:hypothetical protein
MVGGACGKKADSAATGDISAASATSAGGGSGSRFERELARYELTMDKLRRWQVAAEKLQLLQREHPDSIPEDTSGFTEEAVARWTSRVERIPGAHQALADAGFDSREFLLFGVSLSMASAAQVALQQGTDPDSLGREIGANPANLRFVKEHPTEIAKVQHLLK